MFLQNMSKVQIHVIKPPWLQLARPIHLRVIAVEVSYMLTVASIDAMLKDYKLHKFQTLITLLPLASWTSRWPCWKGHRLNLTESLTVRRLNTPFKSYGFPNLVHSAIGNTLLLLKMTSLGCRYHWRNDRIDLKLPEIYSQGSIYIKIFLFSNL